MRAYNQKNKPCKDHKESFNTPNRNNCKGPFQILNSCVHLKQQVSLSMFDLLVDSRRKRDKTDSTDFFWWGWGKSLDYSEKNNRKKLLLKKGKKIMHLMNSANNSTTLTKV